VHDIRHYLTPDGKDVYQQWYDKLRDIKARIAIDRRINRIELGNFGDHKSLKDGIWELRIDVGPGYRLYYAIAGTELFSCFWAATNAHNAPTLSELKNIGLIGKKGANDGQQKNLEVC
jgi:putative addiction module killer protein